MMITHKNERKSFLGSTKGVEEYMEDIISSENQSVCDV
jgi:hypothetical protein